MLSKTPANDAVPPSFSRDIPTAALVRQRNERLQAFKELVTHLAHDFNNALVPLSTYVTLLKEELKTVQRGSQYLPKLESAVAKTDQLTSSLLQATHPERQFSPVQTDLVALLRRLIGEWSKELPSSEAIALEVELAPCTLWLDEKQWTLVVQHLLANARFALEGGGTLKISLQPRRLTETEAADLTLPESDVFELTFTDTGCGMSEEVLQRAFEPFFTTRSDGLVSGLGLTLAHSVVAVHGGQIDLQSLQGYGTCVRIWLPRGGS